MDGTYAIRMHRSGGRRASEAVLTASQVVLAAGTWGTQELLHAMRADGSLPHVSDRLGFLTRTNSEALCSASAKVRDRGKYDFHHGVAITSSIHPDPVTHVEPVRYGKGSNAMGLLNTYLVDGDQRVPRWARVLLIAGRHPGHLGAHRLGVVGGGQMGQGIAQLRSTGLPPTWD